MPGPNSLNHWKITHWTALAKGGFGTVRFLLLQTLSLLDDIGDTKLSRTLCQITIQRLWIVIWCFRGKTPIQQHFFGDNLFGWYQIKSFWDPFCWMVLMIVHVGLRVPIPPIIISTGQHTPFFARIVHTAVYYISVRIEYLTKQCAMQRKTM